jgi:glycosyltransferase involved in cell wall biosynthesis
MPEATILITTRNRRDDLRNAIRSALEQTADTEVLVIDDGSTDGTADVVRAEFPQVRLHREELPSGYIVQRNVGAELARAPVIVSLDDDAVFTSPRTVSQTLSEAAHPRVGAVAIPFVDVHKSDEIQQRAPDDRRIWTTSTYRGTAHALRRDVFLMLGGYRTSLVHQGEEQDYSLRMLNAGMVTRLGRADPIHHLESPYRDLEGRYLRGARNDLLHGWHNVPFPYLPVRLVKSTVYWFWIGHRDHQWRPVLRGLGHGYVDGLRQLRGRRPVTRSAYRIDHEVRRRGPLPLEDLEARLPSKRVPSARA